MKKRKIYFHNWINRVFGNYKTTTIGVLLLILASFGVAAGTISQETYIAILPTVLLLVRAKDTLIGVSDEKDNVNSMPKTK